MNATELYQSKCRKRRTVGSKLPKRGFTKPLHKRQIQRLNKELKRLQEEGE